MFSCEIFLRVLFWQNFFLSLKIFFSSFQLFANGHFHVILTLINVVKLYVENKKIVSTLSNTVEIDNVDLTLVCTKLTYHKERSFASNCFIFWKFCFSLRTSYKEPIWCINDPNAYIRTFCKRWSFIWWCYFPLRILKFCFVLFNPFSTAKIEKFDFWDSNNSTNF